MNRHRKFLDAITILGACIGNHGVWAAPVRYDWQCWTRDFGLAILPVLTLMGLHDVAYTHLMSLVERQGEDGSIPILFLDGKRGHARFLLDKMIRSARSGRPSFMLQRYIEARGDLGRLTPGTKDSELHFVVAALDFLKSPEAAGVISDDDASKLAHAVDRAMDYITSNLLDRDCLMRSCDWRDTMHVGLGDVPLLSNNALLVHAYDMLDRHDCASHLRRRINERYWRGNVLLDYPDTADQRHAFDPLGGALAVLYDVIEPVRYDDVLRCFNSVSTPYGYTIKCRHNALTQREQDVIERTDGVVVWPFVCGYVVLALLHMAGMMRDQEDAPAADRYESVAYKAFNKLAEIDGFAEWYDPWSGAHYGAQEQLWSAMMYVRAFAAIYH